MPTRLTILDVLRQKSDDGVIPIVDEATIAIPEVRQIPAGDITGTSYKTLVRTALPTVNFRQANQGADPSKASYINRRVECFPLNPRFEADVLVCNEHPRGAPGALADEGVAMTEAAWQHVAKQTYYGTANDAKGFPGFVDIVPSAMVKDVAGGTANQRTSVWAVRFGQQNVRYVLGNGGQFGLDDPRKELVADADGKFFTAWIQELLGYVGLQVASQWSVARLKGLTADSGKTLTDNYLADLIELFPAGKKPDAFFMPTRCVGELRRSRTATNATGAPAPYPTEAHGIPIYETQALTIGETA